MATKHFRVTGVVQGVGFRASTQARAIEIGLVGWVKNSANGDVEVLAKGSAEQLNTLKQWLYTGPRFARVDHIQTDDLCEDSPSNPALVASITREFSIR